MQFYFQGSQKLDIRVAISRLDIIAQTQFYHRMFHYLPALNPTLAESLLHFVQTLSHFVRTVSSRAGERGKQQRLGIPHHSFEFRNVVKSGLFIPRRLVPEVHRRLLASRQGGDRQDRHQRRRSHHHRDIWEESAGGSASETGEQIERTARSRSLANIFYRNI